MARRLDSSGLPPAQRAAARALAALERFLRIEVVGGVVLLMAAAIALIWANSPFASGYFALWHVPISVGIGDLVFSQSLHFVINDVLMTVFFLVVGVEIRREIAEGALSTLSQAALPVAAAIGGVIGPALIYLSLNAHPLRAHGWAVPTATDIAFAVGVLALLGRSIPRNVRVFLLALAIIDDVIAVLIIAFFYSEGLDPVGFMIASLGVLSVLGLQRIGVGSAFAYVVPGAIIWVGLLMTGAHPTLAGVVLGLLTPARSMPTVAPPIDLLSCAAQELRNGDGEHTAPEPSPALHRLRVAQREFLPPVVRVHEALHPWVAYGVMPLFALANAGVSLGGLNFAAGGALSVLLGVAVALVVGKPLGIVCSSWLMVRLSWSRLPPGVSWGGVWLVGFLGGIGFTMAIFIAMLAFPYPNLLDAAKFGVLAGSLGAALVGICWGTLYVFRLRRAGRAK